ncbi:MAG: SpoIIE family protein phosphatase [Planctomycetales bacterium]|nr:SpoIIE family protein phosphatase [Planctomycetales bacterium]
MAYLSAIRGTPFGQRYDLLRPVIVLGRHPDCDVTIDVGAVSRQHAKIFRKGQEFVIEDLQSRNGTFVNGELISPLSTLADGDVIRICDVEYTFHSEPQGNLITGVPIASDGSSFGVVLLNDDRLEDSSRAIHSKLDVRGSVHGSQLTSSTETRLKAVLEITQNLGRTVQLDKVLPKVLDTLFKVFMQADRAFIVLKEGDSLIPRWVKTRNEKQQETFRISRTVMNEVMESKQAIISLDASMDERFEMAQSISDFRIRSMIVAPLLDSEQRPMGAIQMDSSDNKRQFDAADLEILASIATQAGVAIENAQLHEQLIIQHRVEQDLLLARKVQQAFLPSSHPQLDGYSFYHYYLPAVQIGGDYFDYIFLSDGRIAIVVADVVGHGVAAALLMAKLSAEIRFLLARESDPAAAITALNSRMTQLNVENFVTLLCLVLDPVESTVDIVNAGHMPPQWLKSKGKLEEPRGKSKGLPIGVDENFVYQAETIKLAPGERLLLFTDGIHEAPDREGELFSLSRVKELFKAPAENMEHVGTRIVDAVQLFTHGTEQADDMCLVVIGKH